MTPSPTTDAQRSPSVLVVLTVQDAAGWLRESLQALAAQTYPRLAVMAVDDGSTDGSGELLAQALGEGRVIRSSERRGPAAALEAAVSIPAAAEADYLLVLHDDTALDPDAVTRLVEAAVGIPGVERVGVVGAKVVDWDDPRLLRDVGRSADRFGHPYAPLQPGEIDQGQFDRVLEVLSVSSSAMLVGRDAWRAVGLFDERLDAAHQELDFCWRARLAGFRVLMTPLARVRHRNVSAAADASDGRRGPRYEEDRAALAAMLKNYAVSSLLGLLPLWLALGTVRLVFLSLARRFEEAYDLMAAWGWNVAHLPGTLARRRRIQRARRIKDRSLRRFMESAGLRLPRWFQTAERILEEQRELDTEEDGEHRSVTRRLRHRTASFVSAHPVIVASFLGVVMGAVATRSLLGGTLYGGSLPAFPPTAGGFFGELDSAYRTTGLGGSLPASPALGAMGLLSALALGSTSLARGLLLVGLPVLAAVMMYRAVARLTGRPGPAVVAAASYAASALVLWAFSVGRLDLLAAVAVMPAIVERFEVAFGPEEPADGRWRFVAGVAVTLALGIAFFPGVALATGVVLGVQLLGGVVRGRGLLLIAEGTVGAAVLLFPFVATLIAGGGAAFGSRIGTTDVVEVARLALGSSPGSWEIAAFFPVAASLAFALTSAEFRARALRAACASVAGLALSWLSAAGYLPGVLTNQAAYAVVAAVALAMTIGYGVASILRGLGREAFGVRQIGTALLTVVLGAGLGLQAIAAMAGGWALGGPDRIPAAWAVVESGASGEFRVLWLGAATGDPFPPPGGDPAGVVEAGPSSVRFGLTDRGGVTSLDTGRPLAGPGGDALHRTLQEILSGATHHAGALLAPFGVRFLVAEEGDLPPGAVALFDAQVDLDVVAASGLQIYRNASELPPAGVIAADEALTRTILSGDPGAIARMGDLRATPLHPVPGGWDGPARDGVVALSSEFDDAWRIAGSDAGPRTAFGWATAFEGTTGPVAVRYGAQLPRTLQMIVLVALWLAALWITRRPVTR
jgi:GT2 family glycosyltransferase